MSWREVVRHGWPVVVVDDGSRDDTAEAARAAGVIVVRHRSTSVRARPCRPASTTRMRRGARHIVTFDADGQHDAKDIPALIAALEDADIALGSRFLGGVEGA